MGWSSHDPHELSWKLLPDSFFLKIQQDKDIYNRWFGQHIHHHFYMDRFRIRLCRFHNDHHEIQQDICTWNHQVYPKYHIYKIFTKNITAIIVGAYYNSKFRIECKNHENHDATQKWNQKWCWISRFDTIQLLHHQEFKPLIMWLRRKVQIRIKNLIEKNTKITIFRKISAKFFCQIYTLGCEMQTTYQTLAAILTGGEGIVRITLVYV